MICVTFSWARTLIPLVILLSAVGCDSAQCSISTLPNGASVLKCPDGTMAQVGSPPSNDAGDEAHATLVRVDPEPAGANCANGGVAIHTGEDLNDDGKLEDNEITSTEYVCSGGQSLLSGTLDDSYTITSAVDESLIVNVTAITGTLTIAAPGLTALSLPNLTRVDGDLVIDGDPALTSIALPALVMIGGGLTIANDPALTSLSGLGALASVGGTLDVRTDAAMTSLSGLDGLRSVGGTFYVRDDAALTSIAALAAFTTCNSLEVTQLPVLASLQGLGAITTLPGGLHVDEDALITDLSGVDQLTSVGALAVTVNAALTSLHGLEQLTTASSVLVDDNLVLTSIAALAHLSSTQAIGVDGNVRLPSLAGLGNVTSLAQDLSVQGNTLVTTLAPLQAMTSVRSLYVASNGLTALGLTALTSVDGDFSITDEPGLKECLVDALLAQIPTMPTTVTTTGDGTGTCP